MKKLIFFHGFFASGQCAMAQALRDNLPDVEVLSPDLPLHPKEVLTFVRDLINKEQPDLLVGNSCGSFYAQILANETGTPALLSNPHLQMDQFVLARLGQHEYKSPRQNGHQEMLLDEALAAEFTELQAHQFEGCRTYMKDRIWGLFGQNDTLAPFEPVYLEHYNHAFHFPGAHQPTPDEIRLYHVPLIRQMLQTCAKWPQNPVDIALQIATVAHAGQLDRDGYPVILHPITVGMMGHTDEEKMAGFLHDVVEDTDFTFDDLLERGIPIGVVNALRLLTHKKGTDYYDYVQHIIDSGNPISLQVKYNDLQHNFARGKAYPDLQQKHGKALEMVRKAVEERSKINLYEAPADPNIEVGIFACGCFWGTQHQFERQPGVLRTLVGYTGGSEEYPSYAEVRDHKTHHVEAVIVEFDPKQTSYEQLCKLFFEIHDPAQTDGVGPDLGQQYRSCIFYRNDEQRQTAESVMQILRRKGDAVNTLLLPESKFYIGEAYHQQYYDKTGGEPYCHLRVKKF